MARVLVFWNRPYHLSAEEAERWALNEVSRLVSLDVVERAELTALQSASRRYWCRWDWMLELHLVDSAAAQRCADGAPCARWLADLRQLGLRPTVLLADGGIALGAGTP